MKAMNLYLLARVTDRTDFSMLAGELTGEIRYKEYSDHEAASMRALIEELAPALREKEGSGHKWISYLDGFYFSYTIAHISKEFDLLKISANGDCILNIELKSDSIDEDRINRQLTQNRYYLSHISNTIYSYTYVMETHTLYFLNDKGHMRACDMEELADVLMKPAFSEFVGEDLDRFFRAADYLISPAVAPEKFLQGGYFLTNQQFEFKRKITELLRDGQRESAPVITVTGGAGTGKTLLLFDLALDLSKKKKVLILLGGKLQSGHRIIDERLRNVEISSAERFKGDEGYSYILVDEANRIPEEAMERLLGFAEDRGIPCIMAYDPHVTIEMEKPYSGTEDRIRELSTLVLEFTGNIRINRPIYSFLRALFHQKEKPASADYSCIDVLYAEDPDTAGIILGYYADKGFHRITLPGAEADPAKGLLEDDIVGLEIDCVAMILDTRFYYDCDGHLRADGNMAQEALSLLYEGISRTRERLCLIVTENENLFDEVFRIRNQ